MGYYSWLTLPDLVLSVLFLTSCGDVWLQRTPLQRSRLQGFPLNHFPLSFRHLVHPFPMSPVQFSTQRFILSPPFQPLRSRHLRVHAEPVVLFLTAVEDLLLQHQLSRQHASPRRHFSDGTLQFGDGRRSGAPHSLRRHGRILWREAARSRWRSLTAPALVPASGLLFDRGDDADTLRDDTSVHGQDCGVCHARALHLALENCCFFEARHIKEQLEAFFNSIPLLLYVFCFCAFLFKLLFSNHVKSLSPMPNLICFFHA